MCGIVGYVNPGGAAPALDIEAAVDLLDHRGPDARGTLDITGPEGPESGRLGHTRLSIIDLSDLGRQPMTYDGGRYAISFNGEIYNFPALRRELAAAGFGFRSRSDTEVALAAYARWGEGFLDRLDGMFALALWDRDEEKLILAKDPFGKKPLYYAEVEGALAFASELKSLLSVLPETPELDPAAVGLYLYLGYVPAPGTIYQGVKKLRPGSYLVCDASGLREKEHFRLAATFENGAAPSFSDAMARLEMLLALAVKKRLISDVPVGIFLSGGIDSSTIASLVRELSGEEVAAFSIGFREREFDELADARRVAGLLGLPLHHETLDAAAMLDLVDGVPEVLDEPVADASILPTYLLSRLTANRVKVALGGDGADELFLGYPTYFAHRAVQPLLGLVPHLRPRLMRLASRAPQRFGNYDLGYRALKFAQGLEKNRITRHFDWMDYASRDLIYELAAPAGAVEGFLRGLEGELGQASLDRDGISDTVYLNQRYYLTESILTKVDRASMAHSLEVRCPFLDRELVSFVNSLPLGYKLKGPLGKYILKRLMAKRLPLGVLLKKKQGFTVPLAQWFNRELKSRVDALLLDESFVKRQGLFDPDALKRTVALHRERRLNLWRPLWALFNFQMWFVRWIGG